LGGRSAAVPPAAVPALVDHLEAHDHPGALDISRFCMVASGVVRMVATDIFRTVALVGLPVDEPPVATDIFRTVVLVGLPRVASGIVHTVATVVSSVDQNIRYAKGSDLFPLGGDFYLVEPGHGLGVRWRGQAKPSRQQ